MHTIKMFVLFLITLMCLMWVFGIAFAFILIFMELWLTLYWLALVLFPAYRNWFWRQNGNLTFGTLNIYCIKYLITPWPTCIASSLGLIFFTYLWNNRSNYGICQITNLRVFPHRIVKLYVSWLLFTVMYIL